MNEMDSQYIGFDEVQEMHDEDELVEVVEEEEQFDPLNYYSRSRRRYLTRKAKLRADITESNAVEAKRVKEKKAKRKRAKTSRKLNRSK